MPSAAVPGEGISQRRGRQEDEAEQWPDDGGVGVAEVIAEQDHQDDGHAWHQQGETADETRHAGVYAERPEAASRTHSLSLACSRPSESACRRPQAETTRQ